MTRSPHLAATKASTSRPRASRETDPQSLLKSGQRLLTRGGKVRTAIKRLVAARDAVSTTDAVLRPQILYWLAQAYMMADDLGAMERAAEDLITIGHESGDPEVEADGYLLFAKAQYLGDRAPVALTSLDCAESLYRDAKHDLGLGHTFRNRGDALSRLGHHERALDAYAAAETLYANEEEPDGLGNTLAAKGDLLFFLGRNDEALFVLDQARKLLVAAGNDHAVGACLRKLGAVHSFLGRTRQALRAYNRAYRIFASMGDERSVADTVYRRGEHFFRKGENDRAIRDFLEAIERHGKSGDIHGRASALNALAEVLLQLGRFEDCLHLASQAEALFLQIDDPMGRGHAVQNLAWAAYQLGRDAEALRRCVEGVSLARERTDRLGEANALATRARVLARLGRDDEALDASTEAASLYRMVGDPIGLSDMQSSSARILRRRGDHAAALASCDEAERLSREADEPLGLANACATRGQVLFAMHRIGEGHEALLQARAAYEAIDARWNLPQLDMELARLLAAAGRFEEARRSALDALQGLDVLRYQGLAARTHTDLVDQFADALVILLEALRRLGNVGELVIAMESRRSWTLGWLERAHETAPTRTARATRRPRSPRRTARLSDVDSPILDLPAVAEHVRRATSEGAIVLAWYPLPAEEDRRVGCLLGLPGHAPAYVELGLEHARLAAATAAVLELGRTQQEAGWEAPLTELGSVVFSSRIVAQYALDNTRLDPCATSLWALLRQFPGAPLAIAPQGLFGLLPWAALLTPDVRHLVEERGVHLLPRFAKPARTTADASRPGRKRAFCFGLGSATLHWTEREANEIGAFLSAHGYKVTRRSGQERETPSGFAELAKHHDILHLATHASFDAADPFQSFLDFGSSTASAEPLRLADVLGLDLAGSTAVLSACSTAVTDWRRVFDPVSLTGAFLSAGCERVIGTLWEVDDASTMLLMRELYRLVLEEGLPWAEALRCTQLGALRGEIRARPSGTGSAVRGLFSGARMSSRRQGLASPLRWGALGLSQ